MSQYDSDKIQRLYDSGMSQSEVAEEVGCSKSTVSRNLDESRSILESLEGRDIGWADRISESLQGHDVSEKTKEILSDVHSDKEPWNKGKTKQSNPDEITYGVSGKDHHAWKGGISSEHKKIRESKEYANWRESVFERDGYTCQKCEQTGGTLNAHHIKPFAEFENERFNTDNGVTLCRECHMNLHYGDNNE